MSLPHARASLLAAALALPACPARPAHPLSPSTEVWLAPNLGSRDLPALFTEPGSWAGARANVQVLQLYAAQVLPGAGCPDCGPNTLDGLARAGAFARLREWDIDLALEVGALKDWGCTADRPARLAAEAVDAVEARGGRVGRLALDEPRLGAEDCGLAPGRAAAEVARFASLAAGRGRPLKIGLVEPYPRFSATALVDWLDRLAAAGFAPAFLHLDVDRTAARREGRPLGQDLRRLAAECRARRVSFGVIYWAEADTDEAWARSVRAQAAEVRGALGSPPQLVFQSWARGADGGHDVPALLPETAPDSLTGLLLELTR